MPTPVTRKTTLRTAISVALAAVTALGLQTGPASAGTDPEPGAAAVRTTPAQQAAAVRAAQADAPARARALGLGDRERLVARSVVEDADGTVHTRYERTYAGLPVLGGDLVVHEKRNGDRKVTKATEARIEVAGTRADVPAEAAERTALRTASARETERAEAGAPRKVVWAAQGEPVLAWETVVTGVQEDGTPSELHVITDADTGERLFAYEGVRNGTGTGDYSGRVPLGTTPGDEGFDLVDAGRGGHRTTDLHQGTSGPGTLFSNPTNEWGGGRQSAAVDVHYGAAVTWDYYEDVHNRNGIRNDGVAAYSRVHYGDNYVNAFWSNSCFCMTYGDGADNANPLTSIDVAAHEMTHGVTSNTAGLIYDAESGGLNEATSDIFASTVEFHAGNRADPGDYLIGEKIDIRGDGTPLRYMDRPSRDGKSEDYWYRGIGRIDVHYSSGPANHFFYLLSEGSGRKEINGVAYDSPTYDGKPVAGIGRDKAERIWYKALTTYMVSTTDYHGARLATLTAAADLYGRDSAEYRGVDAAWAAVNVS